MDPKLYWKRATCVKPCAVCGETDALILEAHHVITQQELKKYDADLWDERNGMSLCRFHHNRHTSRMEPVPHSALTDDHKEFAAEHGLDWYLDRFYPS